MADQPPGSRFSCAVSTLLHLSSSTARTFFPNDFLWRASPLDQPTSYTSGQPFVPPACQPRAYGRNTRTARLNAGR
ncbi:hypothetical protein L227DRAFT_609152 [Lentinus tigrinus ALCF2SS1-6]|uniref:Uncharacterized protein n=1 Tax=Lentinus tigrinus ALCF2SS1-6 TaxID=1328759 RepID=A0A5C2SH00_9APHY|nr:hypothetical protein L227DRAFT_609152 [Lentinus tigrinus ALCF2SS1-6]